MSELASPIKAEPYLLRDIFSDKFLFNIPLFQRPFSWTEEHFEKLFVDIYESMIESKGSGIYFLGSMVLVNERENLHQVIDGQQRLVSLITLIAVARDIIKDNDYKRDLQSLLCQKESPLLKRSKAERLKPWEELEQYFSNYIYVEDGTRKFLQQYKGKLKDEDDPVYHLYEAVKKFHELFAEHFSKLGGEELLHDFIKYLLNNVYVVGIRTVDLSSAIRLFNVLNTRGLPLSSIDIIKGINLDAIPDKSFKDKYAREWIELEGELSREELENLISHVRTIYTKDKARVSLHEEYEKLYKTGKIEKGEKFFQLIREFAEIYEKRVLKPEIDESEPKKRNRYRILVNLMREYLPFSEWIPPVLAFCKKFDTENLLDFLIQLERKTFIEWIAGFSPSERITSFSRVIQIIDDNQNPKDVIHKMISYKPPPTQKTRYIDFNNSSELQKIIEPVLDNEQFYKLKGGKLAKYTLLRLDMELWDLAVFQGYSGPITVEHILPVTPPEKSKWIEIFDEDARKKLTNKLGNLVLLSGSKNSSAGNLDFSQKIEVYIKKQCSPFRLTQKLVEEFQDWNVNNLQKRHKDLIKSVEEIYIQRAPSQLTLF
ncbi:MAG: DUF262 domain-containing HNH endonuclease family protein [Candidatus Bathyarchaeia archaeon]